jgi:manganese transport protein
MMLMTSQGDGTAVLGSDGLDATQSGWRRARGEPGLADIHGSIAVARPGKPLRRFLSFFGPGYLVAVGYMDPGNWATSLAGGSAFGYSLLFVALLSNIMAICLQALSARLGIGAGRDLAQACRDGYPKPVAFVLWLLAELAICATDLAEVIGTAIGLNLLFGIPLSIGVAITALDVFLILALQRLGFRWIEAFVMALLAVIAVCFTVQIYWAKPDWGGVLGGFAPSSELLRNPDMLYLALGIIGATVMPHNLYLHSGIVQTRDAGSTVPERKSAIRMATLDSTLALMFALLINASILILAAAAFHAKGNTGIAELGQVHSLLAPVLGSPMAASLFAIALIACGLNSTVTATLAGQIVMEGFLDLRIPAWARRLITRGVALIPAILVIWFYGEQQTGRMLILSQVVLSLQLPFAVVPLVWFTAQRSKMGAYRAPVWMSIFGAVVATIVILLNLKLLSDFAFGHLG